MTCAAYWSERLLHSMFWRSKEKNLISFMTTVTLHIISLLTLHIHIPWSTYACQAHNDFSWEIQPCNFILSELPQSRISIHSRTTFLSRTPARELISVRNPWTSQAASLYLLSWDCIMFISFWSVDTITFNSATVSFLPTKHRLSRSNILVYLMTQTWMNIQDELTQLTTGLSTGGD